MANTMLENLIDAEVMADAISGKIDSLIRVTPFAKVDTTLEAKNAGDTITVPQFSYIGDAEDVAEGVACVEYSNGKTIYVNYNATKFSGAGISLEPFETTAKGGSNA